MSIVFRNRKGVDIRSINLNANKFVVVRSEANGRLMFLENTKALEASGEKFRVIQEVKRTDITADGLEISNYGSLAVVEQPKLQKDIDASDEDEDRMPIIAKWTSGSYAAALALALLGTWIFNTYFNDANEPVVVQVIEQKRENKKTRTVEVAKTKPKLQKVAKNPSRRKVVSNAQTNRKNPTKITKSTAQRRTAVNVANLGALGALGGIGGYSKTSFGGGGLNTAAKSGSGYGMGGARSAGGHERGLVGNGMVAAGIGNNRGVVGYGGLGTKGGMGGGAPGYGSHKFGGSSGGYFEPLSEESFVEGGLDRDQINAVIMKNRGQITYCYERGLQQDPSMSGRVEVKFVINPVGRVSAANIASSSLSARQVENCIVDRLRGWKFPTPVGNVNVRVSYPFQLQRLSKG